MNKADLTAILSEKTQLSRAEAGKVLDVTIEAISDALVSGETVTLVGFGILTPKKTSARTGRNPKTGESVEVPERNAVSFKLSKAVKQAMNPTT